MPPVSNDVSRVPFATAPFTDADWVDFDSFAKNYFGQSHNRRLEFNRHWFGPDQYGQWNVRKVIRKDTNELRGLMMLIVCAAKFGDVKAPLAWISNAAVSDEAQRSGVGAQLYFWAYKSYPLVGALSGNENSDPINTVMALDIPGTRMERYLVVHDPGRALQFCRPEFRNEVRGLLNEVRLPNTPSSLTVRRSRTLPAAYDDLWQKFSERLFFCIDRSRQFMQWRYESAPFVKYDYLEFSDGGKLTGVVPVRSQDTPFGNVCRIMDLIILPGHEAAVMQALRRHLGESGFVFSDFFLIGTYVSEPLIESGFITARLHPSSRKIPHLLSPIEHREWTNTVNFGGSLAKSDQRWRDPHVIYFTKADSDRDWPTQYDLGES